MKTIEQKIAIWLNSKFYRTKIEKVKENMITNDIDFTLDGMNTNFGLDRILNFLENPTDNKYSISGKVSSDIDYWFEPWEVEARGLESALFTKFAIEEKLWNVFKDVNNLDEPIEVEPIGWKEYS